MPRLSTPPGSSGFGGEATQDGSVRNCVSPAPLGWREEADGTGIEVGHGSGVVEPELFDGSSQGSGDDEIPNEISSEPAVKPEPAVKRKRGRPPKSEMKPKSSEGRSKNKTSPQRRSSRIVEKARASIEKSHDLGVRGRKKAVLRQQKVAPSPSKAVRTAQNKEWEVEKIVDAIHDTKASEMLYRVKWKGYPSKANTWEPMYNLGKCQKAIQKFEAEQNAAPQDPPAKRRRTTKG